ncbi:MAG: Rha family transcriptional regulator, partial [Enterobacteriaceae bacterium]|nr:Rha family transcriptional regulator [Enterobacteriaceae bacterium]
MTNQITLSSPEIAVVNGIAITTSLSIAEYFHKNHKHVLDKIRLIISECDDSYHQPNFRQVVRNVSGGDGAIRKMPMFELTRDAFVLIAMGFTGKKALQWKIEYINAFNKMEAELCNRPVSRTTTDQRTPLRDAVNMLVGKKGLMYPEAYSFIHQRFNVSSIDDLA